MYMRSHPAILLGNIWTLPQNTQINTAQLYIAFVDIYDATTKLVY